MDLISPCLLQAIGTIEVKISLLGPGRKVFNPRLRWITTVYGGHHNNMITDAHCEGANNKCKVKTIIQDNGCLLFYHALA